MRQSRSTSAASTLERSPDKARRRWDSLDATRRTRAGDRDRAQSKFEKLNDYLSISDAVSGALDKLSEDLFENIVSLLEEKLTLALQEVLEQPLALKVDRAYKRGSATIGFYVERDGQPEDIMRGQGGSVANILSVGLRMFALATLDPVRHRRFLVLDEQDCWLRPDLVPRLVKIVHDAGKALGFQVLMISHHDISAFEQYADKIYEFIPDSAGATVVERGQVSSNPDELDLFS